MALISKSNNVVTLINVFTVEPHDQQRLVDLLTEATEAVMRHLPGFVSAHIHKSWDRSRIRQRFRSFGEQRSASFFPARR
jgi:Antibiotic biosynthesis monooxygenase